MYLEYSFLLFPEYHFSREKIRVKAWKRKQRRERGLSALDEEDKAGSDGEEVDTAKDYQDLVFQLS